MSAALAAAMLLVAAACGPSNGSPPASESDSSPAAAAKGKTFRYVALGDSYTAAPRLPKSKLSVPCYRSKRNYPHRLKRMLGDVTLRDVSCSGATTNALTSRQSSAGGEVAPQLAAVDRRTDLVTLGIGGNDHSLFSDWAGKCALLARQDPGGSPCAEANRTDTGDRLLNLVTDIEKRVAASIRKIQRRAPSAQIIVVPYPRLFGDLDCAATSLYATGDHAYIDSIVKALSDAMIDAARSTGVDWVNVYGASRGHEICSSDPWVNGVTSDQSKGTVLHPLPAEQAAVARMLRKKL